MNPVLTVGIDGEEFRIYDPGGGGRVAKILRSGAPYESHVLADMRSLGLSGTAVDVGANIGNHTVWLAAVCGMDVQAFEPYRHAKCEANVTLNRLWDRVVLHKVALGEETDVATCLGGNVMRVGSGDIPVVTLDSFGLTGVSLLKIDVEGMEEQVIRGGVDTISRERPVIYAEAWDDTYRATIDRLLSPFGYRHAKKFRWHQNRWDPS